MPIARFQTPDGRIARFEVPEGTTPEQAQSMMEGFDFSTVEQPKTEQPKPEQSIGRTALDQGLQGATFGFSDEVTDRIGAGIASLATGEKYGDLLNEARNMSKERMQQQVEQNPSTSIAANIGGALLTGGAGATTKAGTAAANMLRAGGTAARIGKGALAGATSGALYGAGTSEEGKRLEGAGQGAILGGVAGGAIPATGAAVSGAIKGSKTAATGAMARTGEQLIEASDDIKLNAANIYTKMRQVGAVLNPSSSNRLLSTVDAAIKQNKFIPALNPKTTGIIDDLAETIRNNNGQIGIDELDQYRRLLGRVGATEDGVSAGAARRAIDSIVDSLDDKSLVSGSREAIDLLKQGRGEYSRASRFEDIADILNKADGDPNKIKNSLTRFMNNDKNIRGWSQEELAALKEAARGTTGEKILKSLGKFGFDLGTSTTMGNTVAPVIGGAVGTAAGSLSTGALVPIGGTIARQGQKYLARGKAENLLNVIQGTAKLPQAKKAITPVLSAPAGAAAGSINAVDQKVVRPNLSTPIMSEPLPPRSDNFDNSVNFVMDIEGGYVADDAGKGETNMGVNKTANPDLDIKNLTPEKAKEVYKKRYWSAIEADKMPPEMALVAFDAAVNHGVGKAKSLIHASKGDPMKLLQLREMEYARLVKSDPKKYAQYAQGWIDRLRKLQSAIA